MKKSTVVVAPMSVGLGYDVRWLICSGYGLVLIVLVGFACVALDRASAWALGQAWAEAGAGADYVSVAPIGASVTRIEIHNPYSFDAIIETKCDWDGGARRWGYYRRLRVRGRASTTLVVPGRMRQCEIWPSIKFF